MAFKLKIEANDLDVLLDKLEKGRRQALPFAVRQSLNDSAFLAKREWARQINNKLVIRNTFTERGIIVEKASGYDVDTMSSVVGGTREYMGRLERGGTVSDPRGVPIHTTVASGEGEGARPRRKVVRPSNRLNRVKRSKGGSGSRKMRNAQAVRAAARSRGSAKVAYLDLGKRKGFFRVSGKGNDIDIKMVIDLSRKATRTPPHPTMSIALRRIQPKLRTLYALSLIRQLRRHGLMP